MIGNVGQLHSMGFESAREYNLYLKIRGALNTEVPVGIAS